MAFIFVYVTNPDRKTASMITEHLLKNKMIACANIFPVESMYWWKGKIETTNEFVAVMKSRKEKWETLKKEIKKIHPYTVPCIVKIDVESNKEYEKWLLDVTG